MKLERRDVPFTQIANEVLSSNLISLKAKGLYAYLFSKPDSWDFSADRIQLETKEERKAILRVLQELEEIGYLTRKRQPSGRVTYVLEFSQSPKVGLGGAEPKYQNATVPKRHGGEVVLVSNKDSDSNKEVGSNTDATALFEDFWKAYPRKTAKHLALKKFTSMRPTPELVAQMIVSIEAHKKTRQWQESSRFIPHAATFLNQRRWEDEVEVAPIISKKTIRV